MKDWTFIDGIRRGTYDPELDTIAQAVSERKARLNQHKLRDFEVGDTVRFIKLGAGAKYMNGLLATIESINFKTVWVRLTPQSKSRIAGTRFGRSNKIKVYPGNIELSHYEGDAVEAPAIKLVGGGE